MRNKQTKKTNIRTTPFLSLSQAQFHSFTAISSTPPQAAEAGNGWYIAIYLFCFFLLTLFPSPVRADHRLQFLQGTWEDGVLSPPQCFLPFLKYIFPAVPPPLMMIGSDVSRGGTIVEPTGTGWNWLPCRPCCHHLAMDTQ